MLQGRDAPGPPHPHPVPHTDAQPLVGEFNNQANCRFLVVPEVCFLALTKHGYMTCQQVTHWLNFQSVPVAAEESSLGLEEGSGHTVASGGGDLL